MFSSTKSSSNLFILILFLSLEAGYYCSTTITVVNKCSFTVFPGILHGVGTSSPSTTGFALHPSESKVLTVPRSWSGRVWGRTHCSYDSNEKFSCLTGDCASSTMECNGGNASPPATLAEFNLNAKSNGFDFFRVNVMNGYNLPMIIEPQVGNGTGDCMTTGCMVHLKKICPSKLKVISTGGDCIGCRSACQPFSKYCYSEFFRKACPLASVDASITFKSVCASTDYRITFCPISTSPIQRRKEKNPTTVDNSVGQKKGSTNNNTFNKILGIIIGGVAFVVIVVITISCACGCTRDSCNCIFELSAGIKSRLPSCS